MTRATYWGQPRAPGHGRVPDEPAFLVPFGRAYSLPMYEPEVVRSVTKHVDIRQIMHNWLVANEWTQRDLSIEIGVREGRLNHWINDRRAMPGEVAFAIEDLTGIDARLWYSRMSTRKFDSPRRVIFHFPLFGMSYRR